MIQKQLDINKIEWIFCDFFDTIMLRNCSVSDLKKKWAMVICNKINILSPQIIYSCRFESEIQLERESKFDGEYIYSDLCNMMYLKLFCTGKEECKISFKDFSKICLETEIEVEKTAQTLNSGVIKLLKDLKTQGKKIALISDFYLTKDIMKEFLSCKDIDNLFDEIFISCDCKKNKRKGKIFPYVCELLGVDFEHCLMIGDNLISDNKIPAKYGINTYYVKKNEMSSKIDKNYLMEQIKKIVKKNCSGENKYSNYAFLLYLFTERLNHFLRVNKFEEVYFLSREGEFLKKIFDLYQTQLHSNDKINSRYLYVSRVSTYVASLDNLEKENFDTIFREYPNINLASFCKSIGFSEENIKTLELSEELKNIDVKNAKVSEYLNILRNLSYFKHNYEIIRTQQNKLIKDYFAQNGLTEDLGKVAIVDVGWKGTIQDNIRKIISKKTDVYGVYVGLTGSSMILENNYKIGLMMSIFPCKSKDYDVWSFDKNFLERLLYASHPSTDKYIEVNDNIKPSFKKFESEKLLYLKIEPIQNHIFQKIQDLCDIFSDGYFYAEDFSDEFKDIHQNTVLCINTRCLKLQKQLLNGQFENFGHNVSFGEIAKTAFGFKNILNGLRTKLHKIRSLNLVCRILTDKNLYVPAVIIYRIKYIMIKINWRK